MKKVALGLVAVILLAVVGLFSYVYVNLDSLVKTAIEKYGSEVAGVKVSLSGVKLDLPNGKATLSGLTVANPSGFNSPAAFKLGEISVALDMGKSTKTLIVIDRVLVAGPDVTYELGGNGGSNIQAIENNVNGYSAKSGAASSSVNAPAASSSGGKDSPKLVIDALDITGGKVTLASPIPGVAGTGSLGDIHLTNIGKSNNGATPEQVAQQVLNALSSSAVKASSSMGVGGAVKSVQDAVKGGDINKAADSLKGLLGK